VSFITGTDEHGEKIALAAEKRDMTPQQHCDSIVQEYKSLWQAMDISYDSFIRTTDNKHEKIVQQVLDRCVVRVLGWCAAQQGARAGVAAGAGLVGGLRSRRRGSSRCSSCCPCDGAG
jgi:hypothetical protein